MRRQPRMVALRERAAFVALAPLLPCVVCGCLGSCDLGDSLVCGLSPETGDTCSSCAGATGGRVRVDQIATLRERAARPDDDVVLQVLTVSSGAHAVGVESPCEDDATGRPRGVA